jgi:CheY-like chemotaxis protein
MTKILIADDEPNILMLTELLFKDMGMKVIKANNGQEAIDLTVSEKPDLVITDIVMPNKNGFEVCRSIRNTPEIANTPIIILSAIGDDYNRITGLEEGANDYITKPFNVDDLKERAKALLIRFKPELQKEIATPTTASPAPTIGHDVKIDLIPTGIKELDDCLFGGLPVGSNILLLGAIGSGKSSFARNFINTGLEKNDKCLFVAIDDDPKRIRQQMDLQGTLRTEDAEKLGLLRFIDSYTWSSFTQPNDEPFAITGMLDLNQLSGVISDAGYDIGQTVQHKLGGRRVIDSISSLLVNFELPAAQRFLNQIARTAISFGGVTTLFIIEEGTVKDMVLNNIRYIMDGILEFAEIDGKRAVRISSMKWTKYTSKWIFY